MLHEDSVNMVKEFSNKKSDKMCNTNKLSVNKHSFSSFFILVYLYFLHSNVIFFNNICNNISNILLTKG